MKKRIGVGFLTLFACIATMFCCRALLANGGEISHVILIGVDGAGVFFKDAETPNMDKIFENGAVAYDVLTSNPTISAECWGAMLHGVTPEYHRLTNEIAGTNRFPEDSIFPSVFRVIRENDSNAKLASFCNWNSINYGIIEENLGVEKGHGANDSVVTDLVCQYLEKEAPTFLFVQYDGVDGAGHSHKYGSPEHLEQIHKTDGYVQRIYDACEKSGILDSTLFIVTADHGGLEYSHGGWSDGEKYIMFAAAGPGVAKKSRVVDMAVRDTSSVVLHALGLDAKQPSTWTSRVPSGLFEGVSAGERPEFTMKYAFEHRSHETAVTPTGENSVVERLGKDRVSAYFPFDGDCVDGLGKVKTVQNGKLYFVDGYFGKGAKFDDGSVSLPEARMEKKSFSIAFWLKTGGVEADPAIISNKDWTNGMTPGFVLSLRSFDIKFNVGNGSERIDPQYPLPFDYIDGWVYVVFFVDREANKVGLSYDFGPFTVSDIPEGLASSDFDAFPTLNIGQDGTGGYPARLGAILDEFLLIDGVLADSDVATLKDAYRAR